MGLNPRDDFSRIGFREIIDALHQNLVPGQMSSGPLIQVVHFLRQSVHQVYDAVYDSRKNKGGNQYHDTRHNGHTDDGCQHPGFRERPLCRCSFVALRYFCIEIHRTEAVRQQFPVLVQEMVKTAHQFVIDRAHQKGQYDADVHRGKGLIDGGEHRVEMGTSNQAVHHQQNAPGKNNGYCCFRIWVIP